MDSRTGEGNDQEANVHEDPVYESGWVVDLDVNGTNLFNSEFFVRTANQDERANNEGSRGLSMTAAGLRGHANVE